MGFRCLFPELKDTHEHEWPEFILKAVVVAYSELFSSELSYWETGSLQNTSMW